MPRPILMMPPPQKVRSVAQSEPSVPLRGVVAAVTGAALAVVMGIQSARAAEDVTISHGISTFGDLRYPADFAHLAYVNPNAPKGGEMSLATLGGFDSMNPYSIKGRAAALASGLFESILTDTADEIGASYCLLCETMEYPADRSWVIFNLRDAAQFSDGSPLSAEDVAFSYDLLRTQGLEDFRFVLAQQIERVEVLGPHRVKYVFKPGFPARDLPALAGGLPVFSKADFARHGRDLSDSTLEPALGSGPYVVDKLAVGQSITYRRNADYWGEDLPINRGRNNFDVIRIEYYADSNAAFEGFKAGNYMFRNENSSKAWATSYDFPALLAGHVIKAELPDGNLASGQAYLMNLRRAQFQDPRVREAIGLMFNFEWSNETLFYGLYARIHSVWENSELAAQGLPSPEEMALLEPLADLLPQGVLTQEAVMAPVSRPSQLDRTNLRQASALLDAAGWAVGKDGVRRNAAGQPLRLEFLSADPLFDRITNPFIENLKRLGIEAFLTRVDDAQMTNRERAHDFDIVTGSLRQGFIPSSGLKQYFGSETADVSSFNLMGLKSPGVDRLIDQVLAAGTKRDLVTATRALDRVLRAERFWVPQWFKNKHTVAYYDLYEHPATIAPYNPGFLDVWWQNADKAAALKSAGVLK